MFEIHANSFYYGIIMGIMFTLAIRYMWQCYKADTENNNDVSQHDEDTEDYIHTIEFGDVPIRWNATGGEWCADCELSGGENAEIRSDSNGYFAILFDENWNRIMA